MKILAFTDLHGSLRDFKSVKKKAKRCDTIICAGDLTFFEEDVEYFLSELNSWGKKVFMIHGNHEGLRNMKIWCKKHKNIRFIHKKVEKFNDVMIIGYGGGGFSHEDEKFEKWGKKITKDVDNFQKNKCKVLFMIHAPPYGTKLDKLDMGHVGNISFREFILRSKLDLVICGHLHENECKKDKLNGIKVINPGPRGKIIKV
ncbi:MAG: metallophosphoesterase family protein [Nanoarchaeota archaeon]|nr:metallophosphoesterase family protein [Nanoarchaeota archaeon]